MTIASRLRSFNELAFPGHLVAPPEWLILGVNNSCNLRCRMCDAGTLNPETNFGANLMGAKARMMPWDLYEEILDKLVAFSPRIKLGFAYTEPLAWPFLARALAAARARGVYTHVTSNGLLLPRMAEALCDAGCNALCISIDGPSDIHNRIRGKSDSYERAVSGIEMVRARSRDVPVTVVTTITEWNTGHLAGHVETMADLDLAGLTIVHNSFVTSQMSDAHNAAHPAYVATRSNDFLSDVSHIDLDLLARDLADVAAVRAPFPVTIQGGIATRAELERYYTQHDTRFTRRCTDVVRLMMIDSDGEVLPANGRCFNFKVANIRDIDLSQAWNAPALRDFRQHLAKSGGLLPGCLRCCGAVSGS